MTQLELDLKIARLNITCINKIQDGVYTPSEAAEYYTIMRNYYYKQYKKANPSWVRKLLIKLGIVK